MLEEKSNINANPGDWKVGMYTTAAVNVEYQYLWSLPIHTFYMLFLLGWSIHLPVTELYGHCLQEGQA